MYVLGLERNFCIFGIFLVLFFVTEKLLLTTWQEEIRRDSWNCDLPASFHGLVTFSQVFDKLPCAAKTINIRAGKEDGFVVLRKD